MSSLPDSTNILIVGAGPAGLATALSLLHRGIRDFVIVDAVPQGKNASRAIVVHAATLEALDTIGCGDAVASQGIKATAVNIGTRSQTLVTPNMPSLKTHTRHPYVLVIPQSLTEDALEKKLASFGVTIHRPLKVVGMRSNMADPQLNDVAFEDGNMITARYVVGADGARSTIRSLAGIGFSDPITSTEEKNTNLAQMIFADVTFDGAEMDSSSYSGSLSPKNFFLCFPLPYTFNEYRVSHGETPISERIYRIGCGVPIEEGEIPHSPSKEYIQSLVDSYGPYRLSSDPSVNPNCKSTVIKEVVWSSRFRNSASVADTIFTRFGSEEGGAIVLVGDAAHIHSPAGGQGMNLGLRDATFLGEALAKHIEASKTKPVAEADAILREFATTRHARAIEVIGLTKGILSVVGQKYRSWTYWWLPINSDAARRWTLWVLGYLPFVTRNMALELSGLSRR